MIEITRNYKRCHTPNLVSMIDIIFLLLIFFMIAGRVERANTLPIYLPKMDHVSKDAAKSVGQAGKKDYMIIYVDVNGNIAVNQDLVAKEDFFTIIQAALLSNPMKIVHLKADTRLSASKLLWIVNKLEEAGVTSVSILAERELS